MQKIINFTEAREKLPELMNMVYFENKSFLVTRRGIPMIRIIKIDSANKIAKKSRADIAKAVKSASGIWKDRWPGKTTNEVVDIIRSKAWRSHAY